MKLVSFNVKGLGSADKRADVLNWLSKKPGEIFFLQETHCSESLLSKWKSQWDGECFLTKFSSTSRGVAILVKKNVDFIVKNVDIDAEGRYIILDVTVESKSIILCNLYAPNDDNPGFFVNLKNKILQHCDKSIILGGDWNLVINPDIDSFNLKKVYNPRSREVVREMMTLLKLEDVFRVMNPDDRKFTWSSKNPLKMSRLDFFLISEELLNISPECNVNYGY